MPSTEQNSLDRYGSAINTAVASGSYERNLHDKMLAMRTIMRCEEILQKEIWDVNDVNLLFTLATSDELKVFRSDEDHDRKYLGKCELWLAEYGKVYSFNLRTQDKYKALWDKLEKNSEVERSKDSVLNQEWFKSKERADQLQDTRVKEMTEALRQAFNSYFFIIRSSLSINGSMVEMLGEDRRSIKYSGLPDSFGKTPEQRWP